MLNQGSDAYSILKFKLQNFPEIIQGIERLEAAADQSLGDLFASLFLESDRGCVLVAAAILDEELSQLFGDTFHGESDATNKEIAFLLTQRPQPPLQSTAIKIRLAHALGFIDRNMMNGMNALQSLRSKVAAHSRKLMRLTADDVIKIGKHLPAAIHDALDAGMRRNNDDPVIDPRLCFCLFCGALITLVKATRLSMNEERRKKKSQSPGSSK